MNGMLRSTALLFLLVLLPLSPVFAQYGTESAMGENLHDGNRLHTTFYNYGLLGNVGVPSFEWPAGSGSEYIQDITPYLAVSYVHPNRETIHSAITCLSPRPNPEYGSDGLFNGFLPVENFISRPDEEGVRLVPVNRRPDSWPPSWPADIRWLGRVWPGIEGLGQVTADLESYWQMDDHQDREFRVLEDEFGTLHSLYPFPDDTSRGGIGLRIEARGLQFTDPYCNNSLIVMYILHNDGVVDITEARFGAVIGTMAGGQFDAEDDLVYRLAGTDLIYSQDGDDQGESGWIPLNDERNVGLAGYAFLKTPDDVGLTSSVTFSPPGAVRMNEDEALWNRVEPGVWEFLEEPADCDVVVGSGGFSLAPGETDTLITAVIMGADTLDLAESYAYLKALIANNWQQPEGASVIESPLPDTELAGDVAIEYLAPDAATVNFFYNLSYDGTGQWLPIALREEVTGEYIWDTTVIGDAARCYLRAVAFDENNDLIGDAINGPYLINNPGDAAPTVYILYPAEPGLDVGKDALIQYWVADPEGDEITLSVEYRPGDGESHVVAESLENNGSFIWENSDLLPNAEEGHLRFVATAGGLTTRVTSVAFRKYDSTDWVHPSLIQHVEGYADARFNVRICNPGASNDLYRVNFDGLGHFSVTNETEDMVLIESHRISDVEGPAFEGLRLTLDRRETHLVQDATGWTEQGDLLDADFELTQLPTGQLYGEVLPIDIDIRFADSVADTSDSLLGANGFRLERMPVPFSVWNVNEERNQPFAFIAGPQWPDSYDRSAIILMDSRTDESGVSWAVEFSADAELGHTENPAEGDTLQLRTFKGFSAQDVYTIDMRSTDVEPVTMEVPESITLSEAWPNPFNERCSIRYQIPASQHVELEVYNLLGQRVSTLVQGTQQPGLHTVTWNADGVASGLYFIRLHSNESTQLRKVLLVR